jgi:hypothetical protein
VVALQANVMGHLNHPTFSPRILYLEVHPMCCEMHFKVRHK